MKFKQLLAAGVLTVAATGITAATAYGSRVGFIPTTVQTVAGPAVRVVPEVDAAATTLTLTSVGAPAPNPVALQHIDQTGNIVAGIAIGCVVGALIGLIFLVVSAIPGCVIGAVIGGIIGANQ
ncbi:hypothetical protein [Nocardia asteroides]|uniref:hypothetical protein n=1 Tax=Nocardia asteroides TaxID=1824 RepID=UPI0036510266